MSDAYKIAVVKASNEGYFGIVSNYGEHIHQTGTWFTKEEAKAAADKWLKKHLANEW